MPTLSLKVPNLRLLFVWLGALLTLVAAPLRAELPARPEGPILDAAQILPAQSEAQLDQRLRAYNQKTGRAVMVVTVPSLEGEDIASYGPALGRAWGVGGKESDQGLILLVAPTERKLRIEVGYGLEQFMPDVLAGRIVRDVIRPRFKADDYPGGINAGIDAIITQLDRDPADAKAMAEAAAAAEANREVRDNPSIGGVIFWLILILLLMSVFGRRRGRGRAYRSGIDPGIVLWGISEAMHHSRGSGGWSGGSSGGGGGIDWGGFGGGDFGGGGASGDW